MKIHFNLFAMQAQFAGTGHLTLSMTDDATVADALKMLRERFAGLPWPTGTLVAVNQEYSGMNTPLSAGDQIAIIPPVSGG
jgi:molybdopterin converting factor small subunit